MTTLRSLVIALVVVFFATPAFAQKVALVVGNSAYQNVARLPNPVNDAHLVANTLRGMGFDVVQTQDATRVGFSQALRSFREKADASDVALVYYAGHGMEVGGRNWLIPTDARLGDERDLEDEAINLESILSAVNSAKRLRVVILDACRDNPFAVTMRRIGGTRAVSRGLADPREVTGTLIVYAAKAGSTASDGGGANSPFAMALARRLPEPGTDIQLVFRRVGDDVLAATANRQEPFQYGALRGEALYLVPPRPVATPTPTVATPPAGNTQPAAPWTVNARAGTAGRDCATCPTLVVAPAGAFMMGSTNGDADERPVQRVTFARPFAIGKYEVTFAEWDACVADRGCATRPSDRGWGRINQPVINVNHADAQQYAAWLSRKTGQRYRLPNEAEWEYAARAGSTGDFAIASALTPQVANFARSVGRTATVGRYPANAWGLHDVHGNVAEWVLNCQTADYVGPPGAAGLSGGCVQRVVRGGSWNISEPHRQRTADRNSAAATSRDDTIGFRILREMP
jgi:formylglycine-generating enzyme required for sulfatase activity